MKITAHELAVIVDTLTHSLAVSNWSGHYTHESRESVRNFIGEIMNEIKVEIVTTPAEPISLSADTGI